jgi:hypothetical protein
MFFSIRVKVCTHGATLQLTKITVANNNLKFDIILLFFNP